MSSVLRWCASAYFKYMRNRSPANSPASSPPAPARISMKMSLSSLGSLGTSSARRRASSSAILGRSRVTSLRAISAIACSESRVMASASSSSAAAALRCSYAVTIGSSCARSFESFLLSSALKDVVSAASFSLTSSKRASTARKRASSDRTLSISNPVTPAEELYVQSRPLEAGSLLLRGAGLGGGLLRLRFVCFLRRGRRLLRLLRRLVASSSRRAHSGCSLRCCGLRRCALHRLRPRCGDFFDRHRRRRLCDGFRSRNGLGFCACLLGDTCFDWLRNALGIRRRGLSDLLGLTLGACHRICFCVRAHLGRLARVFLRLAHC